MAEIMGEKSDRIRWEDAIDRRWQERLMRPLTQPGIIDNSQLSGRIISRSQRFVNRMPLVAHLERRLAGVKNLPASQQPIVYAQPQKSPANAGVASGNARISGRSNTPIIQAKFAPTAMSAGASEVKKPLALARERDSVQMEGPRKQEPTQAGFETERLPIVYAQPVSGEVSNADDTAVFAKAPQGQTPVERLPVVQPRYSDRSNFASQTSYPMRENGETRQSPLPIVQIANEARPWLEQPPHPLLRNQTAANSTASDNSIREPTIGSTGLNPPLIFSPPPSVAGGAQQANKNTGATAAPQSPKLGQANNNIASAISNDKTATVASDRPEENSASKTDEAAKIDVNALADTIERKLMRRLVIENERRGNGRWR